MSVFLASPNWQEGRFHIKSYGQERIILQGEIICIVWGLNDRVVLEYPPGSCLHSLRILSPIAGHPAELFWVDSGSELMRYLAAGLALALQERERCGLGSWDDTLPITIGAPVLGVETVIGQSRLCF